mmetsp:Transcript_25588/g.73919  ORF Transcript_25588/g.73919 Transcript_25588/m.73919 type:complete len:205 (+) Transcript_25588:578-1192(+)
MSSTVACCHHRPPSSRPAAEPPARCRARRRARRCSMGSDSLCMAPNIFLNAASASGCGFLSGCTRSDSCLYCFRILAGSSSSSSGKSNASNSSAASRIHSTASPGARGASGSGLLPGGAFLVALETFFGSSALEGSRFSGLNNFVPSESFTCHLPFSTSKATRVPRCPFSSGFAFSWVRLTFDPGLKPWAFGSAEVLSSAGVCG